MVEFLVILMIAEHVQVAIKAVIGFLRGKAPQSVKSGLRERKELVDQFLKK